VYVYHALGQMNIALNKPANQTDTTSVPSYKIRPQCTAGLAVDGDTVQRHDGNRRCTCSTTLSYNTTWEVDLGGLSTIASILSWDVHSCIQFERAARGSQIFSNMADILTEAMHLYSTGGLTCYSRIRGNYLFIVN